MTTLHERVTPAELARAWEALAAGEFRDAFGAARGAPHRGGVGSAPGAPWWLQRAVVAVVGGHGWSGASTTALLLADTYAAAGCSVRLVDGASPARSGLVAAARTEHGLDATRRWRVGSRGAVQVHRPAEQLVAAADLPDWDAGRQDESAVTVLDTGWPLGQLLAEPSWVGRLLGDVPVVVTGRATALGVRHVEATLTQLHALEVAPGAVALIGSSRRGRIPARVTSVAGTALTQAMRQHRVVILAELAALTGAGIGAADLPRRLSPAGHALTRVIGLRQDAGTRGDPRRRRDPASTASPTRTTRRDGDGSHPPPEGDM